MSYSFNLSLTFLKTFKGWLEPLLSRISSNNRIVAAPVVATINPNTFDFSHDSTKRPWIGGFDWRLSFQWRIDRNSNTSEIDPIKSPTLSGGIFAISKSEFFRTGGYDPKMELWGGDNIEMSFRPG